MHVVRALELLQQFLLRVRGGLATDLFGQGGRGVSRNHPQQQFQRRERFLLIIAGLLQRVFRGQFSVSSGSETT